jgi:hypothetical protein
MTNQALRRSIQTTTQFCVPTALRKVAPLFPEEHRQKILAAAQLCEQTPTLENIEAARESVHTAAHASPPDSPAYAAGHAAAYAAAAAYTASMAYDAYLSAAQQ